MSCVSTASQGGAGKNLVRWLGLSYFRMSPVPGADDVVVVAALIQVHDRRPVTAVVRVTLRERLQRRYARWGSRGRIRVVPDRRSPPRARELWRRGRTAGRSDAGVGG